MEKHRAVQAFAALAQETRLMVFRLVMKAGPLGLPAGLIAETLSVPPATLSFHLKELARAGLIAARREGRRIYYAPDMAGTRDLIGFLTEDCCRGKPEICAPLLNAVQSHGAGRQEPIRPDGGSK